MFYQINKLCDVDMHKKYTLSLIVSIFVRLYLTILRSTKLLVSGPYCHFEVESKEVQMGWHHNTKLFLSVHRNKYL